MGVAAVNRCDLLLNVIDRANDCLPKCSRDELELKLVQVLLARFTGGQLRERQLTDMLTPCRFHEHARVHVSSDC